jgi:hypothetical protein
MLHRIDDRWGGKEAFGKGDAQKSLSLLGGRANTTITIAMGNSSSSKDLDRHSTLLGTGYIEEDNGVLSSWCKRKGQR